MTTSQDLRRVHRIKESGAVLRGGTVGNVWEWGPKSAREDYLLEMQENEFDCFIEHCEDILRYESEAHDLEQLVAGSAEDYKRLLLVVEELKEKGNALAAIVSGNPHRPLDPEAAILDWVMAKSML